VASVAHTPGCDRGSEGSPTTSVTPALRACCPAVASPAPAVTCGRPGARLGPLYPVGRRKRHALDLVAVQYLALKRPGPQVRRGVQVDARRNNGRSILCALCHTICDFDVFLVLCTWLWMQRVRYVRPPRAGAHLPPSSTAHSREASPRHAPPPTRRQPLLHTARVRRCRLGDTAVSCEPVAHGACDRRR